MAGNTLRKVLIALLCLVAAGLSIWLTVQKLTGQIDSLAGCGKGSGCENVLGSKWSVVFGVFPVSAFSSALYLALIASLFMRGGVIRWLRVLAGFLILCAAIWFTVLQIFIIKTICPYCMTVHSLGVLVSILILVMDLKEQSWIASASSLTMAAACVAGLALIQHYGPEPETHRMDTGSDVISGESNANDSLHAQGKGRLVSLLEGKKSYRVAALPHVGAVNSTHVIVKYFDYTCESCMKVHHDLGKSQSKYPGKLTVVVLPVPIERSCNPYLPTGVKDHDNACDLARLALRVWMADPASFAEFHDWLFEYHRQPIEVAEAKAYSLVSGEAMDSIPDTKVEALLAENIGDYKQFVKKTPVMPKILIGDQILQGAPRDAQKLENLLKKELGIGPE